MLAVGVVIMVVIDLIVLIVYTASVLSLDQEIVECTTHLENPKTEEGVSACTDFEAWLA